MYKQCKTLPSKQRQLHIAQSLQKLMKKSPYAKIPVSAICRAAGISRNVFYRYFDSKEDILLFILDSLIKELDEYVLEYSEKEGKKKDVRWRIELFFSFWYEQKEILDILIENNLTNILFERLFQKNCERLLEKSALSEDSSKEQIPQYLTFSIYGLAALMLRWCAGNYKPAPPQMADEVLYLFTEPLFRS